MSTSAPIKKTVYIPEEIPDPDERKLLPAPISEPMPDWLTIPIKEPVKVGR